MLTPIFSSEISGRKYVRSQINNDDWVRLEDRDDCSRYAYAATFAKMNWLYYGACVPPLAAHSWGLTLRLLIRRPQSDHGLRPYQHHPPDHLRSLSRIIVIARIAIPADTTVVVNSTTTTAAGLAIAVRIVTTTADDLPAILPHSPHP